MQKATPKDGFLRVFLGSPSWARTSDLRINSSHPSSLIQFKHFLPAFIILNYQLLAVVFSSLVIYSPCCGLTENLAQT
jgi:hypothetical protein